MPRRIDEDYKHFRDVIRGRTGKSLQKDIEDHTIWRKRARGNPPVLSIPVKKINIRKFKFGEKGEGVGRGPGKPGDVIGRDPQKGKGNQAGDGHQEGIDVQVDLDWVLKFMQDELELPNLLPKETDTYEEVKLKYNSISKNGPRSLRHMKKTLLRALQRSVASGDADEEYLIPGFAQPVKLIKLINDDFRYRQYHEIKIPSSNAVIFFARDSSASMDDYKCEIVSDMAWWIDVWIRRFYQRTERCYFCHDTEAMEVDEDKFYRYRHGGGTKCSSAFKLMAKQFKDRFPPEKWNIYVFYFTDGENWSEDDSEFINTIKEQFPTNDVNFIGITQILAYNYSNSLKVKVDKAIETGVFKKEFLRTTNIGPEVEPKEVRFGYMGYSRLTEEERNNQITRAIKDLLGVKEHRKTPIVTGL